MANEIGHNHISGETLYMCRFQPSGEVFITDGSSYEDWGDSGHDVDDYDVAMTENGSGGHYVCDFDPSENIEEGSYRIAIYLQAGANPADSDICIAQGVIYWDGNAAVTIDKLKYMR